MHFGENQLSPGSLGISPLPTGHPDRLQQTRFGPPRACSARFTLPMGRSPGFGSFPATHRPFGLAFAPAPAVPALASPPGLTRRLILQKARRHTDYSDAPTGWKRTVSGSLSLPSPGCFSPFPHGTGSLSVVGGI